MTISADPIASAYPELEGPARDLFVRTCEVFAELEIRLVNLHPTMRAPAGVLESRNGDREMFGEERLADAVGSAAGGAHSAVAAVDDAVSRFADAPLDDDRAVLALSVD